MSGGCAFTTSPKEAGLNEAQVYASVYGDADDATWQPDDKLLVQLADELHDIIAIGDGLWAQLRKTFSEEAVMQLLLMAGYYRSVAYLANGLRLPLEPEVGRPFPARRS